MTALPSDLLVLADGRLPAGAHAHSSGLEAAVEAGDVRDAAGLQSFLDGLLASAAATSIAVAAAACQAWRDGNHQRLLELDAEESARTPSAALRAASRAQGRQLLRAATAIWPGAEPATLPPLPHGPHLALAQGVAAGRLGLTALDAGRLAAYHAVSGPATAAVRLLGLDPFTVHRVVAEAVASAEPLAQSAAQAGATGELPAGAAPLLEIGGEVHRTREIRMFAS